MLSKYTYQNKINILIYYHNILCLNNINRALEKEAEAELKLLEKIKRKKDRARVKLVEIYEGKSDQLKTTNEEDLKKFIEEELADIEKEEDEDEDPQKSELLKKERLNKLKHLMHDNDVNDSDDEQFDIDKDDAIAESPGLNLGLVQSEVKRSHSPLTLLSLRQKVLLKGKSKRFRNDLKNKNHPQEVDCLKRIIERGIYIYYIFFLINFFFLKYML
jgi:hypothetical protein